jgi:hypothetical protein
MSSRTETMKKRGTSFKTSDLFPSIAVTIPDIEIKSIGWETESGEFTSIGNRWSESKYDFSILPIQDYKSFYISPEPKSDLHVVNKEVNVGRDEKVNVGRDSNLFGANIGANLISSKVEGLINENWVKTLLISSRVIKVTDQTVHCDCLISKDNLKVELRAFPKLLFENIRPLKEGIFVIIKISMKAGSTRTDIIDGKGLGIESDFKDLDNWAELEGFENNRAF